MSSTLHDSGLSGRSTLSDVDSLTKLYQIDRRRLIKVMRKDVNFLRENGLMDYSMLVAIEKDKAHEAKIQTDSIVNLSDDTLKNPMAMYATQHQFTKGERTVHLAIIDYLQEWNLNKKLERLSKTVVLQKDGESLSAIEPNKYAKRFQNFMERNIFV